MKQERYFQRELIKELKRRFPGCVILKLDPNYIQGIPDLLMLYGPRWLMLEVKRFAGASHRPNQDTWVKRLNEMSFARFIFPENKEEVINAIVEFTSRT